MIQLADTTRESLRWLLRDHANPEAVEDSVAVRIGTISGLKTFPVVAQKVITLLAKSDFTIDEITDAIRKDPALAAGVLRLANSPFYYASHSINSLDMAFIRLGRDTVREAIFAVATMQMFPDVLGLGKRIRDHCASVGAIAHTLSTALHVGSPEMLLLAGLMHDIGIMLFIESGEVNYRLDQEQLTDQDYFHDQEVAQVMFDHAVLGAQVLTRWKIGPPVPQLVAVHHRPVEIWNTPQLGGSAACLRLADQFDVYLAEGTQLPVESFLAKISEGPECQLLELSLEALYTLWPEMETARKESIQLFHS